MAEGIINHDFADEVEAMSAGIMPTPINQYTIAVLREIGVDTSGQHSKHVIELLNDQFDIIITLCDYASTNCPIWPQKGERIHIPFEDPYGTEGTEEEILNVYRNTRDKIRGKIGTFIRERIKR